MLLISQVSVQQRHVTRTEEYFLGIFLLRRVVVVICRSNTVGEKQVLKVT